LIDSNPKTYCYINMKKKYKMSLIIIYFSKIKFNEFTDLKAYYFNGPKLLFAE